jgi:hypothetical protein
VLSLFINMFYRVNKKNNMIRKTSLYDNFYEKYRCILDMVGLLGNLKFLMC